MRITIFIGSLYGGGAERVVCNLANYLVAQGHHTEILTMSETEKTYELDEKVTVKSLLALKERKGTIKNMLTRLPRLWKYLKTREKDIYVVMLPKTTIMLLMFRLMIKARVIAAERNDSASYSTSIANMLKKLAPKADGWVFQTEDAKKWYGEAISNCKSIVIPNAVNPAFIRHRYTGEKRKVIAGAGRLDSQKNFTLLIEAFSKIAEDFSDYKLTIYGKGNEEVSLKEFAKKLNLQDRVEFPGNIQNLAEKMERNSLFVLSSDFEGMPNALMEAMALGLPCISTDCPCGGARFLIDDGVNGLLVPVGDAEEMSKAMRRLLENQEYANRLGNEAAKISERLAPEKIYGQWEDFIKSVVEKD